jgi:hypothetical protein
MVTLPDVLAVVEVTVNTFAFVTVTANTASLDVPVVKSKNTRCPFTRPCPAIVTVIVVVVWLYVPDFLTVGSATAILRIEDVPEVTVMPFNRVA